MSYDLYFLAPSGENIETSVLHEYFQARPNFKVQDNQAWYENKDTGVYFSFDLRPSEPEVGGEQAAKYVASFNLNYMRPHIFGLEAEPEVAAFVQAFNLAIQDPQTSGVGNGPYNREGFLLGWNAGNEFGYKAVIAQHGRSAVHYSLPGETIERYWRWNYGRAALQVSFGESAFIPCIMFVVHEQRLLAAVVWGDAIPIVLPRVDLYIIVRKELAPRRFLSAKTDMGIATFDEVQSLVAQFPLHDGPLPFRVVNYSKAPKHILDWVRSLTGVKGKPQLVAVDEILDSEIVDKFAGA